MFPCPRNRSHITKKICFPGRGTHVTSEIINYVFLGRGTHITIDMCFPGSGTYYITGDMHFLGKGTHITRDMCFPGRGTYITGKMCLPERGTHITVICVPLPRKHISLGKYVSLRGETISLVICLSQ